MPALPIIAISIGDPNGIGVEILLKTFQDNSLFEQCIPVVYAIEAFIQKQQLNRVLQERQNLINDLEVLKNG